MNIIMFSYSSYWLIFIVIRMQKKMLKAAWSKHLLLWRRKRNTKRSNFYCLFVFSSETHQQHLSDHKNYSKWKSNKNVATMCKRSFLFNRLLEENLFFHSVNLYAKHCAVYSGYLFNKCSSLLGGKIWWET